MSLKRFGFVDPYKSKCLPCGLDKRCKNGKFEVAGEGRKGILFLVEAPTNFETDTGTPFQGKLYEYLALNLSKYGIALKKDCWRVHVNRCRARNVFYTGQNIDYCSPYLLGQIEKLKPKVIIALGGNASRVLLKKEFSDTSIGRWHGIPIPWTSDKGHRCWVLATYVPIFSKKNKHDNYMPVIEKELGMAMELVDRELPPKLVPYVKHLMDKDEIVKALKKAKTAKYVSIDYETTGLKPESEFMKLVTISLTLGYKEAFDDPYDDDGVETISFPLMFRDVFNENELTEIAEKYTEVVDAPNKLLIAHNAKFEQRWTQEFFGSTFEKGKTYCTQVVSHLIDERPKYTHLKFQTYVNLGVTDYSKNIHQYLVSTGGGNSLNRIEEAPLPEVLEYNGKDTYYTYMLWKIQRAYRKQNPYLDKGIFELEQNGAVSLGKAEAEGFHLIDGYFEANTEKIREEIAALEKELLDTKEAKTFRKQTKRTFKFGNDKDLEIMLYEVIGVRMDKRTASGGRAKDAEVLMSMKHEWADKYLELNKLKKIEGTYFGQINREAIYNKIHTFYNLHTTRTGRSCIAKGTMIEVVRDLSKYPKGIPIEDVRPGDLVYCYDENCKPTIREVKWAGKTGIKKVVKVKWKTQGSGAKGHVKMTPEHKIRLINGKYIEAQNIDLKGDYRSKNCGKRAPRVRALSLHRTTDLRKLYFTGIQEEPYQDHRFIFDHVKGGLNSKAAIHHVDFNNLNNTPDNLLQMSHEYHGFLHSQYVSEERKKRQLEGLKKALKAPKRILSGEEHPSYIKTTRVQIIREFFKARGHIANMPYDFETAKKKIKENGLCVNKLKERFARRGFYITRGMMIRAAHKGIHEIAKELGIGYAKVRDLYKSRGIELKCPGKGHSNKPYTVHHNHIIYDILDEGEVCDVYDLEVEEHHNFIAGGICVHNSSGSPNWQNIPKRDPVAKNYIRKGVIAPKGQQLFEADYGSLEVRIAACYTKDPQLISYILDPSTDMHRDSALDIFEMSLTEYENIDKKLARTVRFHAKNGFVFANFYGSSYRSCARSLWKVSPEVKLFESTNDSFTLAEHLKSQGFNRYEEYEEHIEHVVDKFWKKFSAFRRWQKNTVEFYNKHKYVENFLGFRRRGPLGYNEIINTAIQGTAFMCLLWAFNRLDDIQYLEGWQSRLRGQIHDSIIGSVVPSERDHVLPTIKRVMEKELLEAYDWINVPMIAEFEITPVDGTWADLEGVDV